MNQQVQNSQEDPMDSVLERIKTLENQIQISKIRYPSLEQISFPSLQEVQSAMKNQKLETQASPNYHSLSLHENLLQPSNFSSINKENQYQSKSPVRLTDNFLQFAKSHHNQSKNLSTSPFSQKCTNEYERARDLASIKEKYLKKSTYLRQQPQLMSSTSHNIQIQKLYTPIANRNQNQNNQLMGGFFNNGNQNRYQLTHSKESIYQEDNIMKSLEDNFNDQYSQSDMDVRRQSESINQTTNLNDQREKKLHKMVIALRKYCRREFLARIKKFHTLSLAIEYLLYIRKKTFKQAAFSILKRRTKLTKERVFQFFLKMNSIAQKKTCYKIANYFQTWKYSHQLLDLSEQVHLQDNDLIIERSKLITIQAFSKLNLKIEMINKFAALRAIQNNSRSHQQDEIEFKKINVDLRQKFAMKLVAKIIDSFRKMKLKEAFIMMRESNRNHFQQKSQLSIKAQAQNIMELDRKLNIQIAKSNSKANQPKECSYHGIRALQRMVHSQKKFIQIEPLKDHIKKKNQLVYKPKQRKEAFDYLEYDLEENEEDETNIIGNNHFVSTLAAMNEESLIRFSPNKTNKKLSISTNHKLNISNILKNGAQDTIDEEDHLILARLIQKYQRDFNCLNGAANNNQYNSNLSHSTTLNLNSHDTQANLLATGNQNNTGSQRHSFHKKLHSMLYFDKSNQLIQLESASQNNSLVKDPSQRQNQEILQNILLQFQYQSAGRIQNNNNHIMIDEDLQNNDEEDNTLEDKLSFTSPTSLRLYNPNMKNKLNYNENMKDNSISVSHIEDDNDCQNQSQTRLELQEFQNQVGDRGSGTNKKDFSFSIEKDREQMNGENNQDRKKKQSKEGYSRNYYSNNMIKSKQERENLALNELNNVLNQQFLFAQNMNLRSSDLVAGGTYGGTTSTNGNVYLIHNPQLEQETANFNIGDWGYNRSPMGSTMRPLTRSSLLGKSSQRSQKHQISVCSQNGIQQFEAQKNSPEQQPFAYNEQLQNNNFQYQNLQSPERRQLYSQFTSNQHSLRKLDSQQDHFQMSRLQNDPLDTVSKLNFNYFDQENQDCNSPVQIQSHFANFSQDFVSPDEQRQRTPNGQNMLTQKKDQTLIHNNSLILNTSGATTFAQQSAFEQFRSKINDNLKNLRSQNNSKANLMDSQLQSQQKIQPNNLFVPKKINQNRANSQHISPSHNFLRHLQSKQSDNDYQLDIKEDQNQSRAYQSNQVSVRKLRYNDIMNNQSTDQNEQILINPEPIPKIIQINPRESVGLDMAEPIEMNSLQNSIQNFDLIRQSTKQLILAKDRFNVKQSVQIGIPKQETLDDPDMTLRKSPEPSSYLQQSEKEINVPVLRFDMNINDEKVVFDNLRESVAKNQEKQVHHQHQQSCYPQIFSSLQSLEGDENYFQKRTMSHNDLVLLGTMCQQTLTGQTLQQQPSLSYLAQRSQSIQQLDQQPLQNKFIDAFKQYEAEKVRSRRKSEQISQIQLNNLSQIPECLEISNTQNYSNLFNQFQNQSYSQSMLKGHDYILEETDVNDYQNMDEDYENNNVINEEIQEREAEEEESFINDQSHILMKRKLKFQQAQSLIAQSTINETGTLDANTMSTLNNFNSTHENLNESKKQLRLHKKTNSIATFNKKPKEIVIQLDISSYATHRNENKSFINRTQNISEKSCHSQDRKPKKEPLKPVSNSQPQNNRKQSQKVNNQNNAKNDTQQLLINELLKQQASKNERNFNKTLNNVGTTGQAQKPKKKSMFSTSSANNLTLNSNKSRTKAKNMI